MKRMCCAPKETGPHYGGSSRDEPSDGSIGGAYNAGYKDGYKDGYIKAREDAEALDDP